VNVEQGGYAGRITVVPDKPASTAAGRAVRDQLSKNAAAFAHSSQSQTAVGGTGSDLVDYRNLGLDRLPVVLLALTALSFIVLLIVTRSVASAALAVLLSLATAGAAFGVLALLFGGDSPPLGGPGFVDPVTIIAVLTIILALSIDYEIFAVQRLRMVTGAGLVMLVVLVPFALTTVTLVREFAIGMAVAVAIDTLLVRPLMASRGRDRWKLRRPRPHFHMPRLVHH
jgi:RND superfamily putative drug exporter